LVRYERDKLDNGPFKMLRGDSGDLLGPCMLLEQFLTGTAVLSVHDAAQLRPALLQYATAPFLHYIFVTLGQVRGRVPQDHLPHSHGNTHPSLPSLLEPHLPLPL
jgi:hypothetical protein